MARPTKSDAELKASGTFRADRHKNRAKAEIIDHLPPPEHFDEEHQMKWEEVCGHLRAFDILANQDVDSIKQYVMAVILQRKAWDDIIERGQTIVIQTEKGENERVNPSWRVYCDCDKIIKPLREQFGFTPRSRQGIQVKPKETKKADPLAAILGGGSQAKRKSG